MKHQRGFVFWKKAGPRCYLESMQSGSEGYSEKHRSYLTFAFCSLYCPAVEETGNRWRRLHCLPGSHEPVAAC